MSYFAWDPYIPVAKRRQQAAQKIAQLKKQGQTITPVTPEGRTITKTFWGKAWCCNLERYSDYANRLPRGRTYVRNGSVIDLQIDAGEVTAMVSGSEIYRVNVRVARVPAAHWSALCRDCAGTIDSLVELLQGRLSRAVMDRVCQPGRGLFPSPKDIRLWCSCPDWADMCKHVAAVLYGVGVRLDTQPELLFRLRSVDEKDLLATAGQGIPLTKEGPTSAKVLNGGDLAALFGLEMAAATTQDNPPQPAKTPPKKPTIARKTTLVKTAGKKPSTSHKTKPSTSAKGEKRALASKQKWGTKTVRRKKASVANKAKSATAGKASAKPTYRPIKTGTAQKM